MFFQANNSVLLVIDVQGKLAELVHEKKELYRNIEGLILAAGLLKIPILWTEQVPQKIGKTVEPIAKLLKGNSPISKISFSCCGSAEFQSNLESLKRKQIIVSGIETHVCVYQTVSDLLVKGYDIQVVVDAVSSRTKENKEIALKRMKQLKATLTSTEMILTELLGGANHPQFKEILRLIK